MVLGRAILEGKGIHNLISSLDNIISGFKGIKLVLRNLDYVFSSIIDCLYAAWNARKNLILVI
jgi:hypothetical protein